MKMINQRNMLRLKITHHLGCAYQKVNNKLIDNSEDLDTVMPMYNLLEHSHDYSMTSGSLRNYYRDKIDDVDNNSSDGKLSNYKTKTVKEIPDRPLVVNN